MKKSKTLSEKRGLSWVKKNKRELYRNLWKYADKVLVMVDNGGGYHFIKQIRHQIHEDVLDGIAPPYHLYGEYLNIGYALLNMKEEGTPLTLGFIKLIHKKYHSRWWKFYAAKRMKNGKSYPRPTKTDMIREFLARGFVHEEDFKPEQGEPYVIKANIAPLVWPNSFSQHGDACNLRVGIPGFTSAPIPKT